MPSSITTGIKEVGNDYIQIEIFSRIPVTTNNMTWHAKFDSIYFGMFFVFAQRMAFGMSISYRLDCKKPNISSRTIQSNFNFEKSIDKYIIKIYYWMKNVCYFDDVRWQICMIRHVFWFFFFFSIFKFNIKLI